MKSSCLFIIILGLSTLLPSPILMAAEEAFPPTHPGTIEIKTLPAGILLKSTVDGNYFDNGGKLFGPLFRYISSNDIAMTTPVEAVIDDAAMLFWVAPSEVEKVRGSTATVEVLEIPERTVAARGTKGSYSQTNYQETREALEAWLAEQTDWRATGDPYGVYWNGPFTPWFMKTAEVHIPVERVPSEIDLAAHQWKHRVVLLSAPSASDSTYRDQLALFADRKPDMDERDIVVLSQFDSAAFQAVLVGKDGGRKREQAKPMDPDDLFALIDSMPMRRSEMRQSRD
jgi:hypothetical protein